MCGRFTQHLSWAELHYLADLIGQPHGSQALRNLAPRYNIAPTTQIEVVRPGDGSNALVPMRWGDLCRLGGKSRSVSFLRRLMPAQRRSHRSQCFAPPSSHGAASFQHRASMSGRVRRAQRRRTISARQTAVCSPSLGGGARRRIDSTRGTSGDVRRHTPQDCRDRNARHDKRAALQSM